MPQKNKQKSETRPAKAAKPNTPPHHRAENAKKINLALQGGGAQGAFTWGVLHQMMVSERIDVEAITCTSAGAMNGVVFAYGLISNGRQGACDLLKTFWHRVSLAASMMPIQPTIVDKMMGGMNLDYSPAFMAMDYMTRMFSPYQFNYFDINPLRSILEEMIDFEVIRKNKQIRLFINATNARTGKIRVFNTHEITLDVVMASACLPFIYRTVYVDNEPYWDGGYSGNPAIYPLIYKSSCQDVLIVQINPLVVEEVPTNASDIMDRINEISFNSTLMREMRAIAFVQKLISDGKVTESEYKDMRIHMIESQDLLNGSGRASKLNADWDYLTHLHNVGAQATNDWMGEHFDKLGKESSIDIRKVFL